MAMKKGYRQLVDEANAEIETISAGEAAARMKDGETVLVDIRDIRELQREGRVPGAHHAPRGMLEFWIDPESPYAKPQFQAGGRFVFYCASGWRSALSAKVAQEMGLDNVSHIEDGFKGWQAAGGPVGQKPARKSD